jgi:hypothetical protein
MQREAARPALGMNDMKARLAEILAYHIGKTGIIFDQKDAFAHDCPSVSVSRDASASTTASRTPSSLRLSGVVRG